MRRYFLLFCIVISLSLMVGCWDRIELERNAFILGMSIDSEDDKLLITFQIALIDAFKGESSDKTESTQEITIKSNSIADAANLLLKYTGDVPNFDHCKLIVFGEEYAKKGIKDSLDFLFRNASVRRLTSVCVAEGPGKKILEYKPKTAPSSAMAIDQIITQNSERNSEIVPDLNIGYLHQNFLRKSDIGLNKISMNRGRVEVSGIGVFKDYKLVGWFLGHEVMGVRLILGGLKRGLIGARLPWDKGGEITLRAFDINSKSVPQIKGDRIRMKNTILVEGDINQVQNPWPLKADEKLLHDWEAAFEEEISKTVKTVFKKARDEFGVDSFNLDEKVEAYYSKYWDKHKGEWNQLYKNIELDVDVEAKIRRVGIIKP